MPESRPLTQRSDMANHDEPPATSESSTPYPNRHSRLRRALRNTNDLARDITRERSITGPSAPRHPFAGNPHRNRRRMRDARDDDEDEPDESEEASRRRPKRRKLDADAPAIRTPIKYGHYGQVEPGKLRMEIISCDGGEHTDPRCPEVYLGAKNLLKMDKSVYCSDRSSAGILLRHLDNTPFCLEKLHIVGPEHGFTAPVREGLVYVAMNIADLQPYQDPPYHARRTGIHEPPYPPTASSSRRIIRASPERLTLSDALRDPEISAAADTTTDLPSPGDPYGAAFDFAAADPGCENPSSPAPEDEDEEEPPRSPEMPVTLFSDEEPGDEGEDGSSQEVLDYRLQRLRLMRRRAELETWDRGERWSGLRDLHLDAQDNPWSLSRLEALMSRRRAGDDAPPSNAAAGAGQREEARRTDGEGESGSDDPNVTVARFHIRRGKFRVAIRFDPPVSGRYVLLKMWAGRGNVDVQSVVAKGWGEQRFFPAVELM